MSTAPNQNVSRVDALGAFASVTCAIHCGLSAAIPATLAALGLGSLLGHEAEWVFTLVAAGIALYAAFVGYRHHRNAMISGVLAALAVALIAFRVLEESALGEAAGPLAITTGILLAAGHLVNLRAQRHAKRARQAAEACEEPCCDEPGASD